MDDSLPRRSSASLWCIFSVEGRAYRPIEIGTDNKNAAEFGQLRFDSNTNQYQYETVDHTIYVFSKFADYNPEFMFPPAGTYPPLYLLTSIKAAGKAPLQIIRSQDWSSASYGNIQSIVASDGSTTVFNYTNDYQLSSLSLPSKSSCRVSIRTWLNRAIESAEGD